MIDMIVDSKRYGAIKAAARYIGIEWRERNLHSKAEAQILWNGAVHFMYGDVAGSRIHNPSAQEEDISRHNVTISNFVVTEEFNLKGFLQVVDAIESYLDSYKKRPSHLKTTSLKIHLGDRINLEIGRIAGIR